MESVNEQGVSQESSLVREYGVEEMDALHSHAVCRERVFVAFQPREGEEGVWRILSFIGIGQSNCGRGTQRANYCSRGTHLFACCSPLLLRLLQEVDSRSVVTFPVISTNKRWISV